MLSQQTHLLGTSYLLHYTLFRLPWTHFTFSCRKQKPPSIQMRKHPKSKWLWEHESSLLQVVYVRTEDRVEVGNGRWGSRRVLHVIPCAGQPIQVVLVLKSWWWHGLCTICPNSDLMLISAGAAGTGQNRSPQCSESLSNISELTRPHGQLLLKALEALQPLNLGKH